MKPIILSLAPMLMLTSSASFGATNEAAKAAQSLETLSLEQAFELAERRHPQLAAARAEVDAAAGRAQQAGAWPNPEAILGAQQLPLDRDGSNQREYVAGVAQPIPLGGRLSKARDAELLEGEVRKRGLEVARRDLRKRVHSAFATGLYQTRTFEMLNQVARETERLVAIAKARVAAGDAIPENLARAEMELARAQLEVQRSLASRQQAMLQLAGAIGDPGLNVKSLVGNLDATFEIPTLESLVLNLGDAPEQLEAEASRRASEARMALAAAERIPDVKVEALYHRLDGPGENTLDIGLNIPLPLFNRNQGRLREARAEAATAEVRSRATSHEIHLRLREAYAQLTAALAADRAFKTEILPRAQTAVKAAEARYIAGDTSLAEVLPVRRDWAAIQLSHLESLRDVMQAWGEVARYLKTP